ncbi:MAG: branched-chain amino acid aminotransferase [Deltaproteobacteria bacterium]
MEIKELTVPMHKRKPKPQDESNLGFGKTFTDHMFVMQYIQGKGWYNPKIKPYANLKMDPASLCLHYSQLIFEGLKAYRGDDNSVYLFRPIENAKRLNASATRMCMPEIDTKVFIDAVKALTLCEQEWIPHSEGSSLYIRPTMIATQPLLGVQVSLEYLFYIIASPVGAYYSEGFTPTKIYVEEEFVRSAPGGIGFCKAAANYAASLMASKKASAKGYTQVLWLDAVKRKYVEEVGTSNIFFLIGNELITPPLSGTILPGITRDSVIQLAKSWDIKVTERSISIDEVISAIKETKLTEAFASGTAAIVSPVGTMHYKGVDYNINAGKVGKLTKKLYDNILAIQYGKKKDTFDWRIKIC